VPNILMKYFKTEKLYFSAFRLRCLNFWSEGTTQTIVQLPRQIRVSQKAISRMKQIVFKFICSISIPFVFLITLV
jgi:hypothetical protein